METIEQVVGRHVAEARRREGMSQAELGEAVGSLTGKRWSRATVANAERGERGFTVSDLWTLGLVLNVSPVSLIFPDAASGTVKVGGVSVPAQQFRQLGAGGNGWAQTALTTAGSKVIERASDAAAAVEGFAADLLDTLKVVKAEGEQLKKLAGSERKRKERKA